MVQGQEDIIIQKMCLDFFVSRMVSYHMPWAHARAGRRSAPRHSTGHTNTDRGAQSSKPELRAHTTDTMLDVEIASKCVHPHAPLTLPSCECNIPGLHLVSNVSSEMLYLSHVAKTSLEQASRPPYSPPFAQCRISSHLLPAAEVSYQRRWCCHGGTLAAVGGSGGDSGV